MGQICLSYVFFIFSALSIVFIIIILGKQHKIKHDKIRKKKTKKASQKTKLKQKTKEKFGIEYIELNIFLLVPKGTNRMSTLCQGAVLVVFTHYPI